MRLFGHPLHPALVAFPLGLLLLVPVWDFASPLLGAHDAAAVAYWSELAGLVLGGVAALAGLVDLIGLTRLSDQTALPSALRHAGSALLSLSLFGVALALRGHGDPLRPLVIVFDALGALSLGVTGWLGGHLVFRHGVGVLGGPPVPTQKKPL